MGKVECEVEDIYIGFSRYYGRKLFIVSFMLIKLHLRMLRRFRRD